jgi:hypothetical protein
VEASGRVGLLVGVCQEGLVMGTVMGIIHVLMGITKQIMMGYVHQITVMHTALENVRLSV